MKTKWVNQKANIKVLHKNDILDLKIDDLSSEGAGVAHPSIAVFVAGALPGEVVKAKILKVSKRCAWAKLITIISPSKDRSKPKCKYYRLCGGCNTQHMIYAAELAFKQKKVADALSRIGKFNVEIIDKKIATKTDAKKADMSTRILPIANTNVVDAQEASKVNLGFDCAKSKNENFSVSVLPTHPSPIITHYRNKSSYPVGKNGIGMYRTRSHEIIPIDKCEIQSEKADKVVRLVSNWMQKYSITPYDEKSCTGLIRHIYVRTNKFEECLVCLVINANARGFVLPKSDELIDKIRSDLPKCIGIVLNFNSKKTNVILGRKYQRLWGSEIITDEICGLKFKLNTPSFFQVNRDQAEAIYSRAISVSGIGKNDIALDLYCGVGTTSLCMAGRCKKVFGVEIVPQAINCAKENARLNKIENVEFTCSDAGKFAQKLVAEGALPEIICVDPPRAGLSKECIDAIKLLSPQKLIYISCKPSTLARDLSELKANYSIIYVEPFDMFPKTHHVETLVIMERK